MIFSVCFPKKIGRNTRRMRGKCLFLGRIRACGVNYRPRPPKHTKAIAFEQPIIKLKEFSPLRKTSGSLSCLMFSFFALPTIADITGRMNRVLRAAQNWVCSDLNWVCFAGVVIRFFWRRIASLLVRLLPFQGVLRVLRAFRFGRRDRLIRLRPC